MTPSLLLVRNVNLVQITSVMQPLEGVRIVDFSHVFALPLGTQFLCLLGAEVIKIEAPEGDAMRHYRRDESCAAWQSPSSGRMPARKRWRST